MKNLDSSIKLDAKYVSIGGMMDAETEKAVRLLNTWFPKSQILDGGYTKNENGDTVEYHELFVPLWLYIKSGLGFQKSMTFAEIKNRAK